MFEGPVGNLRDLGTDELRSHPVFQRPLDLFRTEDGTWRVALQRMTMLSKSDASMYHYDFFWPRIIDIEGSLHARPTKHGEQRLVDALFEGRNSDMYQLLLDVLQSADYNYVETLEWLLLYVAMTESDSRMLLPYLIKEPLLETIQVGALRLPTKRIDLDASRMPRTAINPLAFATHPLVRPMELLIPHEDRSALLYFSVEQERAFNQWIQWMHGNVSDDASCRAFVESLFFQRERTFEHCTLSLIPLVSSIVQKRASQGLEQLYAPSDEWQMIDDPMRFVASHLPTWCNSVHPLAELAWLFPSAQHRDYLSLRLFAWFSEQHNRGSLFVSTGEPVPVRETEVKFMPVEVAASAYPVDVVAQLEVDTPVSDEPLPSIEEESSSSSQESYEQSDIVSRFKRARQESAPRQDLTAHLEASMIYAQKRQHATISQIDVVTRAATTVCRRGWGRYLELMQFISLGSWDSGFESMYGARNISYNSILCRHAFDDLCRFISSFPPVVHTWDLKRTISLLTETDRESVSGFLGSSFDMIDLSIDSTARVVDSLAFWCAHVAKFGVMGRYFRKHMLEMTQYQDIERVIASLLCTTPILFHRDNALKTADAWTNKQSIIHQLLGSIALSLFREQQSIGSLTVFVVGLALKNLVMPGAVGIKVWQKCLDALQCAYQEDSRRHSEKAMLYPLHHIMEHVCVGTGSADVAGYRWTFTALNLIRVKYGLDEIEEPKEVVAAEKPAVALASSKNAWSLMRVPLKSKEETKTLRQPLTERGLKGLLAFVKHLVTMTLPFKPDVRAALLRELDRDAQGDQATADKWLAWCYRISVRALDQDLVMRGAKISLYCDHEWTRHFYLAQWLGRPWIYE